LKLLFFPKANLQKVPKTSGQVGFNIQLIAWD